MILKEKKHLPLLSMFIVLFLKLMACRPYIEDGNSLQHLTANPNSTNVAILFQGDRSGGIEAGTIADMRIMSQYLPEFGFQIDKQQATTPDHVHTTSGAAANRVGSDGTLLWFITTHGAPNGQLSIGTQGGYFTDFGNVAAAMRKARGDKAIKRLIVFIEACFSGQNINGQTAITQNSGSGGISGNGQGRIDYGFALVGPEEKENDVMVANSDGFSLYENPMMNPLPMMNQVQNPLINPMINPTMNQMQNPLLYMNPNSIRMYQDQMILSVLQNLSNSLSSLNGNSTFPNNQTMNNSIGNMNTTLGGSTNLSGQLYEQAIIITSSAGNEYSYLQGNGSYAVLAFQAAFETLRSKRSTATIGEFLNIMQDEVATDQQNIQFRVDPPEIKSQLLFQ